MADKHKKRGFWGSLWDILTCPFVALIELIAMILSADG